MKCPKCGYLGFETTDRCRNCGYDFSLAAAPVAAKELSLRGDPEPEAPLADFDLTGVVTPRTIDTPESFELQLDKRATQTAVQTPPRLEAFEAPPTPAPDPEPVRARPRPAPAEDEAMRVEADSPLLAAPRPARPPLAVRRATPELPRARARPTPRRIDAPTLDLEEPADATRAAGDAVHAASRADGELAGAGARVAAALIDILLLASIDAVVVILTLRITGLSLTAEDLAVLRPVPLGAFFAVLALGYLVGFTAGGGQTIGKMALGLRVIGDDGGHVDLAGTVLRSLGALAAVVTLGLLYVPVLITADRRAVHDRLAGTRVIRDR